MFLPDMATFATPELPIAEFLILSTMTVATSDQGGEPHAAAVYFVADDALTFYFFSDRRSQHGQDFMQRPQVAVAIYPECLDWQEIRGLQLQGEVRSVDPGQEWEHAWSLYTDKFPFIGELREQVARNQLYRFLPTWIRLIDNRRGFGYKQEWRRTLQADFPAQSLWHWQRIGGLETGAGRGGA
jgi:uncharacterized protein YhbP (UPF0306 family)